MMSIIVNNKDIFNDFKMMVSKENNKQINTICLYSPKGKGKTTVINCFSDYCIENNITYTLTDFNDSYSSFNHITDFLDNVISELQTSTTSDIPFVNYYEETKNLYDKQANPEVIIEKTAMFHTTVGPVFINPDTQARDQHYSQTIIQAFFKDIKSIKKKIVIFIDHFENAPKEIKNIIINFFFKKDLLKPNIFLVLATEEDIFSKLSSKRFNHVKLSRLPDEYNYDDWKKFCEEIAVDETLLKPIYKSYKNNPLSMRIALKPHEGSSTK